MRSSASASRSSAASRVARMRDQLGDHRIVVRRDLAARLDAGVNADTGRAIAAPRSCRSTAESRCRDPRHKAAPRRRGRRGAPAPVSSGKLSPAATRNCHSTRSRPVTASVTGCSTCSRVFISMNQKRVRAQPLRAVGDEFDGAGAGIADRACAASTAAAPICARSSAVMPGAGASSITF